MRRCSRCGSCALLNTSAVPQCTVRRRCLGTARPLHLESRTCWICSAAALARSKSFMGVVHSTTHTTPQQSTRQQYVIGSAGANMVLNNVGDVAREGPRVACPAAHLPNGVQVEGGDGDAAGGELGGEGLPVVAQVHIVRQAGQPGVQHRVVRRPRLLPPLRQRRSAQRLHGSTGRRSGRTACRLDGKRMACRFLLFFYSQQLHRRSHANAASPDAQDLVRDATPPSPAPNGHSSVLRAGVLPAGPTIEGVSGET